MYREEANKKPIAARLEGLREIGRLLRESLETAVKYPPDSTGRPNALTMAERATEEPGAFVADSELMGPAVAGEQIRRRGVAVPTATVLILYPCTESWPPLGRPLDHNAVARTPTLRHRLTSGDICAVHEPVWNPDYGRVNPKHVAPKTLPPVLSRAPPRPTWASH